MAKSNKSQAVSDLRSQGLDTNQVFDMFQLSTDKLQTLIDK
jgi:hypothetical protein